VCVLKAKGWISLVSSISQEVSKYVVECAGANPPVPRRSTPADLGCCSSVYWRNTPLSSPFSGISSILA